MLVWSLLILFTVAAATAWVVWLKRPIPFNGFESLPPYRVRKTLLGSNERAYHKALKRAIGGRCLIFPKVCLSQILQPPGQDPSFRSHWQRVQRRCLDFLVCDATLTPILAIKLDPNAKRRRKGKDDVLDDALKAADLPLLRVQPAERYDLEEVICNVRFALASHGTETLIGLDLPMREKDDAESDSDSFLEVHFPKLRRWTSDLWFAASGRAH